jgi:hypothetical protein
MSDSVTVDASAPMQFGGDVRTVLESPPAVMPPKTLEEARNQPGRREQIEQITKRIESEGIKYVFFQQVSVTGRVMGRESSPPTSRRSPRGLPARLRRHLGRRWLQQVPALPASVSATRT